MRLCAILTAAALASLILPAHAVVHYVDIGGGGDFDNISAAVGAASEGDTILVAAGTYTGANNKNIDPLGTNLQFIGEAGRNFVIIDCQFDGQAFNFHNGEDTKTLISGFTIEDAQFSMSGGAIGVSSSSAIAIDGCQFKGCSSDVNGGALSFVGSESVITNTQFTDNFAQFRGGAIHATGSPLQISNCVLDGNFLVDDSYGGGALFLNTGTEDIQFCTFFENDTDQIMIFSGSADVSISNSVIASGTAGRPVGISNSGVATVTHCVIFGNAEDDSLECAHAENIFADPLFCDEEAGNFSYCDDSSAVDYNNMWNEQIGAFTSGCDPCGTPVEDATWGEIKALFR